MTTASLDEDLARELRSRGVRRGSGWRWLDRPGGTTLAFIDVQDVDGATLFLHAYTREGLGQPVTADR